MAILGIFLPLLPTTPFLLLAAACYAKGSKRFYNWLLNNKFFGKYITSYREGKGIPIKSKIITISLLWLTISYSVIFVVAIFIGQLLLILIAVGVTYHILTLNTLRK